MAIRQTVDADASLPEPVAPLAGLGPGELLQCRNPAYGLTWFYGRENGESVRYHPHDEWESKPTPKTAIAAVVADPDVSTCRVTENRLAVERRADDGE